MNKYIYQAMLCSAVAMTALSSCELDQYPETSLPTERSWQTVADATNFNVGLLSSLRAVTGGSKAYITEVQSDLFNGRTGLAQLNRYHQWTFTSSDTEGDIIWSSNYSLITDANNIINNIDNVAVEEGSEDETTLRHYKGAAYFARAYAYANLVVRYCNNYDPATAETTLGLPLVTEVDVNARPGRANLAQTYERITQDIQSAKELLADDTDTDISAPHYNAVEALEARVSLQMKDYTNAITCAQNLIDLYPLINNVSSFSDMWAYDEGSEIIYEPQQTQDEVANSYQTIYIGFSSSLNAYNPYFVPTQGLLDLYESRDIRRSTYFLYTTAATNDLTVNGVYIFNKFPGNPDLLKDANSQTTFYNMSKAFRVAEMYLIAAEASYMRDGNDGGYLNMLRSARNASQLNLTGDALFTEIKNEWAREMCGEGFRLDCLKRWGDPCHRMTAQRLQAGFLLDQANTQDLDIPAGDRRFVWEIPSNDLQANPNLERNWADEN